MRTDPSVRKVLHIIHGFGTGGAETWLLAAVRHLHRHPELRMHFDFLATGGVKERFDDEVLATGSRIFYLPYSMGKARGFGKAFRTILREGGYDVVHDHQDFISGWHFLFGSGALPAMRVSHLHNPYNFVDNYVDGPGRFLSFRLGRWLTARYATRITGTSDSVMDEYGYDKWPFRGKRAAPIYCGIDMQGFRYDPAAAAQIRSELGLPANGIRIALFVGRIGMQDEDRSRNQKNPSFALDTALRLVGADPSWHVLFAGHKGRAGEEMEQRIADQGLSGRIKFLGVRSDVPVLMSASDVFLFPSIWEGLGMVAVEAQATGLRVVMSDSVPAESVVCPELVTRLSLDLGADAWADAIRKVTAKDIGDRLSYNEQAVRSPFSVERSLAALDELYASRS